MKLFTTVINCPHYFIVCPEIWCNLVQCFPLSSDECLILVTTRPLAYALIYCPPECRWPFTSVVSGHLFIPGCKDNHCFDAYSVQWGHVHNMWRTRFWIVFLKGILYINFIILIPTWEGGWFFIFRLFKSILLCVNWISSCIFHILYSANMLCLLILYFD